MKIPQWNKRFLSSTRGRVIALLRGSVCTVNELAEALDVTDNAVRAHLATLERDGLVQQSGFKAGLRKPHVEYELTDEAELLFPKSLGGIMNQLLDVMGQQLSEKQAGDILKEVAHRLAAAPAEEAKSLDLEGRVQVLLDMISSMGGMAKVERHKDHFLIHGLSCPLAEVVCEHGEVCQMSQMLISEIVQAPVLERCERNGKVECYFEIKNT